MLIAQGLRGLNMSELMISRAFVKKLASNIRVTYGKEVKHTDAIELVAGSLGWKADALMHKLKQADTARSENCSDKEKISKTQKAKSGLKSDNGFENFELLKSFFYAVVNDELEVAKEYASLISERNAWCCLALAFYHYALVKKKSGEGCSVKAEKCLLKAFRTDLETLKYVAQIVNVPFDTSSDSSKLIHMINQRDHSFNSTLQGWFIRGDLMAWATKFAQDWGFLVNTEDGVVINANARFQDRNFELNGVNAIKWFLRSEHFWDYVLEDLDINDLDRMFAEQLSILRYPVLSAIEGINGEEFSIDRAIGTFKPEILVSIANHEYGITRPSCLISTNDRKKVGTVLREYSNVKIVDSEKYVLLDGSKRSDDLDRFYKHMLAKTEVLSIS
jgi:hypothetical protein